MIGMSRATGLAISDLDHLRQSIHDIASTRIGTRLCRRSYGSLVPDLIDQPVNALTRLRLMSALATALITWEPRVRVQKIALSATANSAAWDADISLTRIDTPQPQALTLALSLGAAA